MKIENSNQNQKDCHQDNMSFVCILVGKVV